MKHLLTALIILLFASSLSAQKNWSLGLLYQPKLTNIQPDKNSDHFKKDYGFEAGLRFAKKLSSFFEFDGRLLYSIYNSKYNIPIDDSDPVDPIFTENGKMKYQYEYSYFSIPLSLNYYFLSGENFKVAVRGGISIDKWLGKEVTTIVGENLNNEDPPNYNISGIIGVPVKIDLNGKINLLLEPQFNSQLLNNTKNDNWKTHLYGMGINIGIII